MVVGEREAIISGIGQSQVGRRLGRSGLDLTLEAIQRALEDAGLDRKDIDGVASWPGYRADMPAFSPVSINQVKESLALDLNWYSAGNEATQMGALINACMAVASGQARHVICYRSMIESTALTQGVHRVTLVVPGASPASESIRFLSRRRHLPTGSAWLPAVIFMSSMLAANSWRRWLSMRVATPG